MVYKNDLTGRSHRGLLSLRLRGWSVILIKVSVGPHVRRNSLHFVPKSARKRISVADTRYSKRTSDALRFLVAPFAIFFFCGREGLASPGPKTSSGKSQLDI